VGTCDMRYPEMIWAVGSRIDLNPWIQGRGPLDADYTWRKVSFSLTGKSKEGGSLFFEITKRSFDWRVVIAHGHIVESWREELVQPSSISTIATWRVDMPQHRIPEIASRENALWISVWS
jgi:hypothetical protein